jgi:hypothetical protein
MSEGTQQTTDEAASESRRRRKDFVTLHIPLVVFVALATYATINQYHRWQSGVDHSFAYMIQWPIIGIFAIIVWNRYRKHGSFSNWIGRHYRERAAKFEAEAEAKERAQVAILEEDPDTKAWQAYVDQLHREDPPGGPPESANKP